jgi:hypothetical protein
VSKKDVNDNRPSSKELARKARVFVRENRNWMIEYIKPMILYILACNLIVAFGEPYSSIFNLIRIVPVYLFACFAMSWHRAVLLGVKHEHKINPLKPNKEDISFFMIFFVVTLAPFFLSLIVLWALSGDWFGRVGITKENSYLIFVYIACYILVTAKVLPLSFVLPARSVGSNMSRRETLAVSKGLVFRLISTSFRATVLPIIGAFFAYVVVSFICVSIYGLFVEIIGIKDTSETVGKVLLAVFSPIAETWLVALNVTILSYLYQWAVQNRPMGTAQSPSS